MLNYRFVCNQTIPCFIFSYVNSCNLCVVFNTLDSRLVRSLWCINIIFFPLCFRSQRTYFFLRSPFSIENLVMRRSFFGCTANQFKIGGEHLCSFYFQKICDVSSLNSCKQDIRLDSCQIYFCVFFNTRRKATVYILVSFKVWIVFSC